MFGYIKTDIPNMYVKDSVLYRSLYCGLCKSIGGTCGQISRLALNYDLTFLSAFFHNILGQDIVIERHRCVMHWFIPREIANDDSLTRRISALNTILTYNKLNDDVLDSNRSKGKRAFFKKGYARAAKLEPKLNEIVSRNYKNLLDYEKVKGESVDISADSFGCMIKEITREILADKTSASAEELGYNLGKWIYLIDALDDFDADKKKNNYNPFCLTYKNVKTAKELLEKHGEDISYVFSTVLENIASISKQLKYCFNHDLTDNILQKGLAVKTTSIFKKDKELNNKCKRTTKS